MKESFEKNKCSLLTISWAIQRNAELPGNEAIADIMKKNLAFNLPILADEELDSRFPRITNFEESSMFGK
jgi:hypothetical protein